MGYRVAKDGEEACAEDFGPVCVELRAVLHGHVRGSMNGERERRRVCSTFPVAREGALNKCPHPGFERWRGRRGDAGIAPRVLWPPTRSKRKRTGRLRPRPIQVPLNAVEVLFDLGLRSAGRDDPGTLDRIKERIRAPLGREEIVQPGALVPRLGADVSPRLDAGGEAYPGSLGMFGIKRVGCPDVVLADLVDRPI